MRNIIVTMAILLFSAATPSVSLCAAETSKLDSISEKIAQYPVIRAEFIQTKHMQALKKPLITKGKFTYSQADGVLWQIVQPYRISYVLGEDKVVEIDASGVRKEKGLREVPGLAQVGRLFRAILGANTSALHTYFDVTMPANSELEDTGKWQITLKPLQQNSKSISLIELSGKEFVQTIVITESSGDATMLRFENIHGFKPMQGTTNLTDAELQLFGKSITTLGKPVAP